MQAVGGAMSTFPALAKLSLMPPETLARLAAIGQASPGPNMLLIPLVGWQVAGIPGGIVAALGFCLPSAALVAWTFKRWRAFKASAMKAALQSAFSAVGAAAVTLSAVAFLKVAGATLAGAALVALVAAVSSKTKIPPIALIAAGGLIGAFGIL